jgi:phosphoenolpyruvate---glycerone phosphotransferase subunit DhaK
MRNFLVGSNDAAEAVLNGVLAVHPATIERVDGHWGVIYRGNKKRRIKIVVGGGSGHEPLFLGAVGPGMADGAVAGSIFAAPNPGAILAVSEAVDAEEGVLLVYGNYAGDVLNFGFAAEEGAAKGLKIAEVRVHDDIASAPVADLGERRGTAGDIFVFKCASAVADSGASIDEVVRLTELANHRTRSLGVALQAASSVETGKPMFELPIGQMEVGMGLHGEMGVHRSDFEPANLLVPRMVELIVDDFRGSEIELKRVAVMVNGLGSTTILELLAVSGFLRSELTRRGIEAEYFGSGQFATSLDMAGFSITITALTNELSRLLDAPCQSVAFTK